MAGNEDVEKNEPKKKSILSLKNLIILVSIILFQMVFSFILISKLVKPKVQYSSGTMKSEKKGKDKLGEIYLVNDVIVNPRETVGRRYVNVSIGLGCKDNSIISELEKNDVKVRDYFITLFSNCTFDELDAAEDKDILRKKIKNDLNKMISNNGIRAVYFTNFVLQ